MTWQLDWNSGIAWSILASFQVYKIVICLFFYFLYALFRRKYTILWRFRHVAKKQVLQTDKLWSSWLWRKLTTCKLSPKSCLNPVVTVNQFEILAFPCQFRQVLRFIKILSAYCSTKVQACSKKTSLSKQTNFNSVGYRSDGATIVYGKILKAKSKCLADATLLG